VSNLIPQSARVARYIQQRKFFQAFAETSTGSLFWSVLLAIGNAIFKVVDSRYWGWTWLVGSPVIFYMSGVQLIDGYFDGNLWESPWGTVIGYAACVWMFYFIWWREIIKPARDLFKGARYTYKDRYHHGLVIGFNVSKSDNKLLIKDVDGDKPRWVQRKDVDRFCTRKELKVASVLEI
jgi:hypothetical protein